MLRYDVWYASHFMTESSGREEHFNLYKKVGCHKNPMGYSLYELLQYTLYYGGKHNKFNNRKGSLMSPPRIESFSGEYFLSLKYEKQTACSYDGFFISDR